MCTLVVYSSQHHFNPQESSLWIAVNMSAQQVHASHKGVGFSSSVTCRCVAIASPSPSGTGHAGWPEVHSARSPSSQLCCLLFCLPLVLGERCPLANDLPACLAIFHIVVLPLLIFAVLALLSACTEANGRYDVSSTIAICPNNTKRVSCKAEDPCFLQCCSLHSNRSDNKSMA